jgi:hypothetical protein
VGAGDGVSISNATAGSAIYAMRALESKKSKGAKIRGKEKNKTDPYARPHASCVLVYSFRDIFVLALQNCSICVDGTPSPPPKKSTKPLHLRRSSCWRRSRHIRRALGRGAEASRSSIESFPGRNVCFPWLRARVFTAHG